MLRQKQGLEKCSLDNPGIFAFHLELVSSPCCLYNHDLSCVHGHILQARKLELNLLPLKKSFRNRGIPNVPGTGSSLQLPD